MQIIHLIISHYSHVHRVNYSTAFHSYPQCFPTSKGTKSQIHAPVSVNIDVETNSFWKRYLFTLFVFQNCLINSEILLRNEQRVVRIPRSIPS